jgi:hypothetical protein
MGYASHATRTPLLLKAAPNDQERSGNHHYFCADHMDRPDILLQDRESVQGPVSEEVPGQEGQDNHLGQDKIEEAGCTADLCRCETPEQKTEGQEDEEDGQAVRPYIRQRAPTQLESRFLPQDNMAP